MKTTHIEIEGMGCEGCVASARQALRGVPGVREVEVDLARGGARVEHDEAVDGNALIAAVAVAGYDARFTSGHPPAPRTP